MSLTPFRKEIGDVDGLGLALRAEICTDDGFTPNKALLDKMVDIGLAGDLEHNGKKIGLVLDVGGWYRNVITFAPSLDITHEEIDLAISLLDQLLTKAKKSWSPVACCKRKARREIAGPFALPHPFRGGCPPVSIYLPVVRCMGGRVRGQGVRRPKPEGAPVMERGWRSFASAAPIGILQLDTEPLAMKNTVRTVFRPFAAGLVAILIGMHGPASRAADVPAPSAMPPVAAPPAGVYHLDKAHASLQLRVSHMGFSTYTTRFSRFDAALTFDPRNIPASKLVATVETASLEMDAAPKMCIDIVQGPQLLDAAKFPKIVFRSEKIQMTGAKSFEIEGTLDLHGVTRPLTLTGTYNGGYAGMPGMDPHARIGFSAHGAFKRSDFGMGFGVPAPGTTMGVGDLIDVTLEAEFIGPALANTTGKPR